MLNVRVPRSCPPISVALPIYVATPALESAFACIASQETADLDILLVLNGSDAATRERAHALVRSDARARLFELPKANLAAALNLALRHARHDMVARMDADDACPSHRLPVQAEALSRDASLAGVGGAYRVCTPEGRSLFTVRPPTDPREMRWRLLLGNMLAHGSMLLRRDAVLSVGGYDESLRRAQDFDLWLRLVRAHRIASVPDVLYDYRATSESGADRSGEEQANVAARCMMREWRLLPERDDSDAGERAIAGTLCRDQDPAAARAALATHLTIHGPTRETLAIWNWATAHTPSPPAQALRAARRALVREVTRTLRARGVARVWLYPAGAFTRSILTHADDVAVPVAGLVDDAPSSSCAGDLAIVRPESVPTGEHVLIASDWHEEALWNSAAPMRARGVVFHRLHAFDAAWSDTSHPINLGGGTPLAPLVHADSQRSKVA